MVSILNNCLYSVSSTDPLPLKKRHLRNFQNVNLESKESVKETMRLLPSQALREEPLIVSSPVALEQQVQIVLADSVNDLQPHKEEPVTNSEQFSLKEETLLKVSTSTAPSSVETPYINSTVTLQSTVVTAATNSAGILQRRPSDPRLVNISPVSSSTNPVVSPGGGCPLVTSAVSPGAVPSTGQSVLQFSQSGDSSGTPSKKKVRMLCPWMFRRGLAQLFTCNSVHQSLEHKQRNTTCIWLCFGEGRGGEGTGNF